MNRVEMEQVIIQGGSVSIGGRVISRVQDLPSDADLALGDEQREAAARQAIDDKIAALQKERQQLDAAIAARKTAPTKKA